MSPDGKVCPFVFGQTELSDDDEALERKDLDQKIGKIILEIQRVKITGSKRLNKMETLRNIRRNGDLSIGKVHESVKQLSTEHRVILGEPLSSVQAHERSHSSVYMVDYLDEKPWATFIFEYRSLDVLKRLKIAPRSPKAKSVPLPRPRSLSPGLEYVTPPPDNQASQNAPVMDPSPHPPPPIASSPSAGLEYVTPPPDNQASKNAHVMDPSPPPPPIASSPAHEFSG